MKALILFGLFFGMTAGPLGLLFLMENRRWAPWAALALCGSSIALLAYLLLGSAAENQSACEAKGGVYVLRSNICVKKEAVIQ